MKVLKSHIPLTALVLSFAFTNTVLAAESTTNESKDNGAANTISNADLTNNAGSDTATPVAQANTAVSDQPASQPQAINDAQYRKQMDERRQQAQQAQQEAYERFLEQRKQNITAFNSNIPADVQERRNEFMKQMEERRALNINESKANEAANTISNAGSDTTSPAAQNADSETASSVAQADTAVTGQKASQPQTINDDQNYRKQMDERRQQAQQAQLEAYKNFLERRKQYTAEFNNDIPADVQERRNEFMKQMEERRALNIKMMEEHRKAADERRAAMQLKMHRTSTTPESAGKA